MVQEALLELAALKWPAHEHDCVVRVRGVSSQRTSPERAPRRHVVLPPLLVEPSRDDARASTSPAVA